MQHSALERLKYPLRAFVVRHAAGPYATAVLAGASALESIISPVPLETVLAPLIVVQPHRWLFYATVATLSSVGGALIGYGIGYGLFEVFGASIVNFYGLAEEIEQASVLLADNMFSATFISAFTPIPYKVFTLAAGVLGGQIGVFVVASIIGRGLRFFLFAYLVHRFGVFLARLVFRYFTIATVLGVVLVVFALLLVYGM